MAARGLRPRWAIVPARPDALGCAARLVSSKETIAVSPSVHATWTRRGTAAGLYLPLTWVRARAPDAIVYIFPRDQLVPATPRFLSGVRTAGDLAEAHPDRLVLTEGPATVIAATVDAMWAVGCICMPHAIGLFEQLVEVIDTPYEQTALDSIYLGMPTASFSRDILARVPDRCMHAVT